VLLNTAVAFPCAESNPDPLEEGKHRACRFKGCEPAIMKPWRDQMHAVLFCSRIIGRKKIGKEERLIGGDFENTRIE